MSERIAGVVSGLAVLALAVASPIASAEGQDERIAAGRTLFGARGCSGCHTVAGTGGQVGPDLSRLGTRFTEAAMRVWLTTPDSQKLTVHNQVTLTLTDAEVRALAAYLSSLR
jgi:cytochrome c553